MQQFDKMVVLYYQWWLY